MDFSPHPGHPSKAPGVCRDVTEHESQHGHDQRMVLTQSDLDAIKKVACGCPHGMTAEDVFRLRGFLEWWEGIKSTVGDYVIKTILVLIVTIGVLVAWVTNGGPKS